MRRICAWCGKDLGVRDAKEPADESTVMSTICGDCADRLAAYRKPVLVVSREWARMYEELVEMLKTRPDIQVVLDRRLPTEEGDEDAGWDGPDRRRRDYSFVLK